MPFNTTVGGGVLGSIRHPREGGMPSQRVFATHAVPRIESDTMIVAVTSPNLSLGHPNKNGWFLSDFYAFNYLFSGLGASQTWLTRVEPQRLLNHWPEVTQHLHGNPYQDRKIVLSQELLDNNELTPVTIEHGNIAERFLREVERASAEAVRLNRPLLLMAFCHGMENHSLLLNNTEGKSLKISELKTNIASGCRVTMLTTACYSGGWTAVDLERDDYSSHSDSTNPNLVAAASEVEVFNSWIHSNSIDKKFRGSIFASALIGRLTHETSDLLAIPDAAGPYALPGRNGAALQPTPATDDQANAYNEFCLGILDICRIDITRLWSTHNFTFAAQDGRTGIPLRNFQKRWDALRNHPYNPSQEDKWMESASQHRLKAMAKVFLDEACPGDSSRGYGQLVTGLLNDAAEGRPIPEDEYEEDEVRIDPVEMMSFRVGMGHLADFIVERFGLTFPSGRRCIDWHELEWTTKCRYLIRNFEQHHHDALCAVIGAEIAPNPTRVQGPPFHRFHAFLGAAIVASTITGERIRDLARQMARFARALEGHVCETLILENQDLRRRGREWLQTLGR